MATASLELGIDIGSIDLVCQIGSPRRIATFLQRVGRSGHTIDGLPKGRLFPTSRDDLIECTALLRAVRQGELDRILTHDAPLDVLAQQVTAEASSEDCGEEELFALIKRAWPYRDLSRREFDAVLKMAAEGFHTRRGRRGALLHRDEVNGRVRGRRGTRQLAITSGGAIPEVADYRVLLEGEDTFLGTLNEDFAIESHAGDIFQLGNASWLVLQVGSGVVRVADAHGAPPSIPFWLGEAPARSDELSRAVSDLRDGAPGRLHQWLVEESGIQPAAAMEIASYLEHARVVLGEMPTQHTLIAERFFDESGGMQLVIHSPYGARINRAWGLALRKRFCRQFDFELQAAATDDAILLSLSPQHSFPLSDVFRYLHPATARDVLVQAFLDAPVWQTRWRWNSTISLAIPRNRRGRKVPPNLQRSMADDLMAAVFPDAAACFENIGGDRQIPDHPLVNQAVRDCLYEAMDFAGLERVLEGIHSGAIRCLARDLPEPSPLAAEILRARPYSFLDDAPLEERRTHAVYTRRAGGEVGVLDPAAMARVREEERPDPRDADELHDILLTVGFLTAEEIPLALFEELAATRRAGRAGQWFVAAERLPELMALHRVETALVAPLSRQKEWSREAALLEMIRGRMTITGPITAAALSDTLAVPESDVEVALLALESEGVILRGSFSAPQPEWCDRRLLARIHRYTLNKLRAEIEPVTLDDFTRFLFAWQHLSAPLTGLDGLRAVLAQLEGFEANTAAWEKSILPARIQDYDTALLDILCLDGEVRWSRDGTSLSFHIEGGFLSPANEETPALSQEGRRILDLLRTRGASFTRDLGSSEALEELAAAGLVTSDGFMGRRGRWSLIDQSGEQAGEEIAERQARVLLRRYGVVFRRLLTRESKALPWRELAHALRRLEARGEIRGGRFVHGMPGEQFALPEAVERLRETRRSSRDGAMRLISASDPLNLLGILHSGERIRAIPATRIVYRDGVALSYMEGDFLRPLGETDPALASAAAAVLAGRNVPVTRGFVGRAISR